MPKRGRDAQLGVYWKGKCKDSLKKDRQMIVDFLSSAFGGPVVYLETLRNLGIPERETTEFLVAAASLKSDVVQASYVLGI